MTNRNESTYHGRVIERCTHGDAQCRIHLAKMSRHFGNLLYYLIFLLEPAFSIDTGQGVQATKIKERLSERSQRLAGQEFYKDYPL